MPSRHQTPIDPLSLLAKQDVIMKGYVQVYTGDGKGKTTAAIGLSLRAAGAGLKVFIAQFIKMGDYSEIKALQRFSDLISVEQYGLGRFIKGKPSIEDIEAARKGLEKVHAVLMDAQHDVVIMEEANVAVMCGLFFSRRYPRVDRHQTGVCGVDYYRPGSRSPNCRKGRSGYRDEMHQALL